MIKRDLVTGITVTYKCIEEIPTSYPQHRQPKLTLGDSVTSGR